MVVGRTIKAAAALAVVSFSVVPVAPAQQVDEARAAQVDSLFASVDRPGSPGAALVVVRDGAVVYKRGYGWANLEHKIPITSSTVFDIASVSKQFTGMAIAMLVEQGKLSLDDDIRRHIPEVPDFGHTITVDHLVHHISGIRDWPGTLAVGGWRMDDVISFDQILRMVWNQRDLNFDPGAEHLYSNTGYNLLAELVGRVSGQSFREWTHANIFEPLGMHDTHFQDDHTEVIDNKAYAYARAREGYRALPNGLTALGSSSLFTSVDDLAKWAMNFDDGRVGGMAVIERMHQRGVLNDGEQIAYAFGLSIGNYRGLETASHSGGWAGFRTFLVRFPEHRFAVILLSNLSSFNPSRRAYQVADIFLADHLEPRDTAEAGGGRAKVAVDPRILDEYVGTYRLGPGWLVTITREGDSLMTQATAERKFPMTAVSQTEFYVEAYGAAIEFRRDESGEVAHIEYRGMHAPRVEPFTPAAGQLEEYKGVYYSEELDTSYELVTDDEGLVARHRRHGEIELTPLLKDEFRGSMWFFRVVNFVRDDNGAVMGLLVTNGRSRNLRFVKMER